MEVILFTVSIAISAFLLFWIQPLTAKFFLPILGGSPSVWQTCMVFFQAMLLLGYTYAHYISKKFEINKQILIHISVMLIALTFLPIFSQNIVPITAGQDPNVWLLTELFTHVALPFFIISTSAPLLQRWFSHTLHHSASDPYYLYAASNLGSLIALLGFPFLLEPLFGNYWQNILWTWGYVVYAGLLIGISFFMFRLTNTVLTEPVEQTPSEVIPVKTKLLWIALSCIPSSLLLGVTTTITTDIASTPLFWVIPLAIYLLTFILCFNPASSGIYLVFNKIHPYALCGLVIMLLGAKLGHYFSVPSILIHLATFTAIAFICHGQLYQSRPHKSSLTEFYLLIAFGGFLGGLFNSIVSPLIFNSLLEYPLMLCIACLFRVSTLENRYSLKNKILLIPLVNIVLLVILQVIMAHAPPDASIYLYSFTALYFLSALSLVILRRHLLSMTLQLMIILFLFPTYFNVASETIFQHRNFFGVLKVRDIKPLNIRTMMHGTTLHGLERLNDKKIHRSYYVPLTYISKSLYHPNRPARIAIAGLGAGSLACIIGNGNEELTFYEIDPDVVDLAENPDYFRYLHDCKPKGGIVVGDARLSIEKAKPKYFDLIVLDAFSSDSLPVHLINLNAVSLYLEKLEQHGFLAFNISNRHLDLIPVLAAICNKLDLQCYNTTYISDDVNFSLNSKWVFVTRPHVNIIKTLEVSQWHLLPKTIKSPLWTDDYSNIVTLLR